RRREDQHAADDRRHLVQPEAEAGHDTEVAATAPDRPEQVGMVVDVDAQELAVRRDDLRAEQTVDGEAVLARQEADAPAERDAADTHRTGVTEAGGEPMVASGPGVRAGGEPRAGPRRAAVHVDVERAKITQVEHEA